MHGVEHFRRSDSLFKLESQKHDSDQRLIVCWTNCSSVRKKKRSKSLRLYSSFHLISWLGTLLVFLHTITIRPSEYLTLVNFLCCGMTLENMAKYKQLTDASFELLEKWLIYTRYKEVPMDHHWMCCKIFGIACLEDSPCLVRLLSTISGCLSHLWVLNAVFPNTNTCRTTGGSG